MRQNFINIEDNTPKSGKLSIALYPNQMRKTRGKATSYYARVVNRRTLRMEDIFNDLLSDDGSTDTALMRKIWNTVINAIAFRISSGVSVDFGLGVLSPVVTGSFASEQSEFSWSRNRISVQYRPSQGMKDTMATLEPVITRGKIACPEVIRVYDHGSSWDSTNLTEEQTLESGTLTRGKLLIIEGKKLCIAGDHVDVGLYFVSETNPDKFVRLKADGLCRNQPTVLECLVPDELDADDTYKLRVVTQYLGKDKCRDEPLSETFPTEFTVK